MERIVKQTPVNDSDFKYEVLVVSDPCPPPPTIAARNVIRNLLNTCLQTPGMLDCGMTPFTSAKIYHDGDKWNIVLEAVGR